MGGPSLDGRQVQPVDVASIFRWTEICRPTEVGRYMSDATGRTLQIFVWNEKF